MAQIPRLILAATPAQERALNREPHETVAHMAYRAGPGLRLMRIGDQIPGRGGLLYFAMEPGLAGERGDSLCVQLVRECAVRGYRGAVADLPAGCDALAGQLDRALAQRRLELFVPEQYARQAPQARVLVSTAISGGSLRQRLEQALETHGPERTTAALERTAEDFVPPARNGAGTPLSQQELEALRCRIQPSIYWSPELCARYFTYFDAGRAHFVLFDDPETLRAKLRTAGDVGVRECLVTWEDLCPELCADPSG